MGGSRAARRSEKAETFGQREIPFSIPFEDNLARVHLERLDLYGECANVRQTEESRHKKYMAGRSLRPSTPKKSTIGNAKIPPKRTRSVPSLLPQVERVSKPEEAT